MVAKTEKINPEGNYSDAPETQDVPDASAATT